MLSRPIVVLKFGGSVLTEESRFADVTEEIRRWRDEGWNVVAVVSALCGRTDALAARCASSKLVPDEHTRAGVLALGERESAALLSLRLDEEGVPSASLTPGGVGLRATGTALDASPTALDVRAFGDVLERKGVVVFPGFVALDGAGRTVTLGRGGSDLTALFLADRLGARRVRLVKDVDGLYERDPHEAGPAPARYLGATYDDALATDGSIVQHKAVRFAREHRVSFELGAIDGASPTRIGVKGTELAPAQAAL